MSTSAALQLFVDYMLGYVAPPPQEPRKYHTRPDRALSDDQIRSIRALLAEKRLSHTQIGRQFGISKDMVSAIYRRKSYRDVE